MYAASTSGPRRSRLKVAKRLAKLSGHPFLPATQKALQDVSASLHAGNFRSLPNYLTDWRREHLKAGHAWTEGLAAMKRDAAACSWA